MPGLNYEPTSQDVTVRIGTHGKRNSASWKLKQPYTYNPTSDDDGGGDDDATKLANPRTERANNNCNSTAQQHEGTNPRGSNRRRRAWHSWSQHYFDTMLPRPFLAKSPCTCPVHHRTRQRSRRKTTRRGTVS
eukprot:589874-Pyramimonas_sp.AAC.1